MAVFTYRALLDNSPKNGVIAADTPRTARDLLRARGLVVESLAATHNSRRRSFRLPFRQRHAAKRVAMIRELSTLLAAGIPLLDAVDSLALQQTGAFKSAILNLRDRIAAGSSLADAMRVQPEVFDALSVHMVEAGESSGALDAVLDQLANFSERYLQLKDRVVSALFYPAIVFLLSCAVGVFLMTVVAPMLLDNLLEADRKIPWPTRVLKAQSDFVRGHGAALAGLGVASALALTAALQTQSGRRLWHRLLLKLPVLGAMARKQEIARLALVTSTLLKSGIVLLEALTIAGRSVRNPPYRLQPIERVPIPKGLHHPAQRWSRKRPALGANRARETPTLKG